MFNARSNDPIVTAKITALNRMAASVMITNADLHVAYMNASALRLLREAEGELQQVIAGFRVDEMLGKDIGRILTAVSINVQTILASEKMHAVTVVFGPRSFDLVISPLRDGQMRLGYVLEWTDARQRLLNRDYAAQIASISRSQVMIEFAPDGTILNANQNFLNTMGYSLDEVVGRKHALFVPAAEVSSEAYVKFWDDLRRGQFRAAQFPRVTKSGKRIWIEGSYNPIFDDQGRVVKIVKFATDISERVGLIEQLRGLVEEVEREMAQSSQQTSSAGAAMQTTLDGVQASAANAQELAASINEIARTMSASRGAVEHAFGETVSVGKSTESLAGAAQAMSGIVGLIQNVASQINLLALNATIEAARAGDAGKGFAVVASEVKNLAIQAARATEQITREIEETQKISAHVASAVTTIRSAMDTVRESVSATAAAVEEQSAVTAGMSQTMRGATAAVETASSGLAGINVAVAKVTDAMQRTRSAADRLAI